MRHALIVCILWIVSSALLTECGPDELSSSLAEALPRDETRPTFVFFYIDG